LPRLRLRLSIHPKFSIESNPVCFDSVEHSLLQADAIFFGLDSVLVDYRLRNLRFFFFAMTLPVLPNLIINIVRFSDFFGTNAS
jgi:hypothetical protein